MRKKRIIIAIAVLVVLGNYIYQVHYNYRFTEINKNKFYKSGTIPPDKIVEYVDRYKIKTIIDLRESGSKDSVNNPEEAKDIKAERMAVNAIKGVNYFRVPSEQIPNQQNLDAYFTILDNEENYPILVHCHHGIGRAGLYAALYEIEYEGHSNEEARKNTRTLVKFSSFDNNTPKGEYIKSYIKRNESFVK
ncbi:fused DSP-PTPase phosphatase/NAD kinase-like protein [Flavobacterium sp. '19STA2R22 D10 B1']|uniref:fused DSP-PTPase phosphatase/NAD kinase-like protein n=1 Tax=Flavobacterium aerium TaxID=3037261 RepID=UPI00278C87A4|nr:tyrosine-protein phosphatase [Flavobacterium sp. '19STA2R22 D10 B1']